MALNVLGNQNVKRHPQLILTQILAAIDHWSSVLFLNHLLRFFCHAGNLRLLFSRLTFHSIMKTQIAMASAELRIRLNWASNYRVKLNGMKQLPFRGITINSTELEWNKKSVLQMAHYNFQVLESKDPRLLLLQSPFGTTVNILKSSAKKLFCKLCNHSSTILKPFRKNWNETTHL